jgi:hypothetical protein
LDPAFYHKQAADVATTMNWPTEMISAEPKCIYPPCAASRVQTGDTTPCSNRVQEKCVQDIKFDAAGSTYSIQGPDLVAKCILSNSPKTKNPTTNPDVPTATVKAPKEPTVVDTFIGRIQSYLDEYNNPATTNTRKQIILAVGALVVGGLVVLVLSNESEEDDG